MSSSGNIAPVDSLNMSNTMNTTSQNKNSDFTKGALEVTYNGRSRSYSNPEPLRLSWLSSKGLSNSIVNRNLASNNDFRFGYSSRSNNKNRPLSSFFPRSRRIPRPRNAFILFRQRFHKTVIKEGKMINSTREVSKELGRRWRNLTKQERDYWNEMANIEKRNHTKMYPDYKFAPKRSQKRQESSNYQKSKGKTLESSSISSENREHSEKMYNAIDWSDFLSECQELQPKGETNLKNSRQEIPEFQQAPSLNISNNESNNNIRPQHLFSVFSQSTPSSSTHCEYMSNQIADEPLQVEHNSSVDPGSQDFWDSCLYDGYDFLFSPTLKRRSV